MAFSCVCCARVAHPGRSYCLRCATCRCNTGDVRCTPDVGDATIEVRLLADGTTLAVFVHGMQRCSHRSRPFVIGVAHGLSLRLGDEVEFSIDARLPHEVIAMVCPACGASEEDTEIETWAVDGESDVCDRAECKACKHEAHAGLFEVSK